MAKTGLTEAAVVGKGFIRGRPVVLGITDFNFMAGSMGSVVGEKLTYAVEQATELKQSSGCSTIEFRVLVSGDSVSLKARAAVEEDTPADRRSPEGRCRAATMPPAN